MVGKERVDFVIVINVQIIEQFGYLVIMLLQVMHVINAAATELLI